MDFLYEDFVTEEGGGLKIHFFEQNSSKNHFKTVKSTQTPTISRIKLISLKVLKYEVHKAKSVPKFFTDSLNLTLVSLIHF